jgi:hypothetical protein
MSATWRPGANWRRQADALAAAADVVGRWTGLTAAELLSRFADPPPYYGQPVAEFRADRRSAPALRREAPTDAERECERRAEERYQAAVSRIRRRYGLAAKADRAA